MKHTTPISLLRQLSWPLLSSHIHKTKTRSCRCRAYVIDLYTAEPVLMIVITLMLSVSAMTKLMRECRWRKARGTACWTAVLDDVKTCSPRINRLDLDVKTVQLNYSGLPLRFRQSIHHCNPPTQSRYVSAPHSSLLMRLKKDITLISLHRLSHMSFRITLLVL